MEASAIVAEFKHIPNEILCESKGARGQEIRVEIAFRDFRQKGSRY